MKKAIAIIFSFVLLFSLVGCSVFEDKVLTSLGKASSEEFFTYGGFQDYTDYAKYSYDNVDFTDNSYFKQITSDDQEKLIDHIDDFEQLIDTIKENDAVYDRTSEIAINYDFSRSIISANDYCYIYDDPDYPELGNYDVYFFDLETMTLYYFHNNI